MQTPAEGRDLVAEALAVEGVTDVFSARSRMNALPAIVTGSVGLTDGPVPEILVEDRDGGTVTARIGTSSTGDTCSTVRAVADLLVSAVDAAGEVRVTVTRIR